MDGDSPVEGSHPFFCLYTLDSLDNLDGLDESRNKLFKKIWQLKKQKKE